MTSSRLAFRFAFVCCRPKAAGFESGPSFIYRCLNLALALRAAGHSAQVAHYSRFDPTQHYDTVIFHRPRYSFGFRRTLKKLQKNGTRCLADFDDLVFHPQWAAFSPGVVNQQVSLKQTEKNFKQHYRALQLFDEVTLSTTPLIDKLREVHAAKPLFVPNAVHLNWRAQQHWPAKPERPRITYFPGTRSHDRDFASIKAPLEAFLHDTPLAQLQITGDLGDSVKLSARPEQIIRHPKQSFNDYAAHVATSWLNLAPLEDTLFNQHKSALKTIEASYFNAPTLASPIPDMERLEQAGSKLAITADDWYQGFTEFASAPTTTDIKARSNLREAILKVADAHQVAHSLINDLFPQASGLHLKSQAQKGQRNEA